jgi:hypothetical protein
MQPISFASLTAIIVEVKSALADGRISIYEAFRLVALLVSELRAAGLGVQKISAPEKLQAESLQKLFEDFRAAIADKKITPREAVAIAHDLLGCIREFLGEEQAANAFEFMAATGE